MIPKNNHQPVGSLTQLSYVLPRSSLHLLPSEVKKKLLEMYPRGYRMDFKIYWSFCKYFWEAHVDFPEINIDHIQDLIHLCSNNVKMLFLLLGSQVNLQHYIL